MRTRRDEALAIRADLNEKGYSDTTILDNILTNMLSGDEAFRAMDLVAEDFGEVEEENDECPECGLCEEECECMEDLDEEDANMFDKVGLPVVDWSVFTNTKL